MTKIRIEISNQEVSKFQQFTDKYGILIMYLSSLLSLITATYFQIHELMLIPITMFLLYDMWFRWIRQGKENWSGHGRSYKGTVDSISSASQYTSFFIAFIAISLSLALSTDIPIALKALFSELIIQCYGFVVLAFSGLVLLFIPIPYLTGGNTKEPSDALKNCFFAVLFMEKTIILLLMYLIIQVSKTFIT
ncbi:MAG: hypothetical protein Roseis2KO_48540 [Roseivirga sp.]